MKEIKEYIAKYFLVVEVIGDDENCYAADVIIYNWNEHKDYWRFIQQKFPDWTFFCYKFNNNKNPLVHLCWGK